MKQDGLKILMVKILLYFSSSLTKVFIRYQWQI